VWGGELYLDQFRYKVDYGRGSLKGGFKKARGGKEKRVEVEKPHAAEADEDRYHLGALQGQEGEKFFGVGKGELLSRKTILRNVASC